jgi:hypothetical protein
MSYFPSITQNTVIDVANSNSSTLAAGATWNAAGVGTSTIGFQGAQVVVKSDQNMTLTIEQGITNSTFQISDQYNYNTITDDFGITVKIVSPFIRVSLKNIGSSLATYSVNSTLTPITEPLPRSLDSLGNLKTAIYGIEDLHQNFVEISSLGTMNTNQPYRLVGTTFGASIDTNNWTATNNGTGSASGVSAGMATVTSGTAANAWGRFTSTRVGRAIVDNVTKYRGAVRMPTLTQANTNRQWGAFTATAGSAGVLPIPTDGYFFALNGANVLSVNSRNAGGTINSVASGSFNGLVSQFIMDTNVHAYEINYLYTETEFVIDGVLVHTFSPTTALLSSTQDLPIMILSTNSVGTTTASVEVWTSAIVRLGRDLTAPIYRHVAGALANTVLKVGSGTLRNVVVNQWVTGTIISLFDSATTTNAIAIINPTTTGGTHQEQSFALNFGVDFYTGLTVTVVNGSTDVTIIYE